MRPAYIFVRFDHTGGNATVSSIFNKLPRRFNKLTSFKTGGPQVWKSETLGREMSADL